MPTNGEGDIDGFVARMGNMKHINSRKFLKQVFDTFGWEFDWIPEEEYQLQRQKTKKKSKPTEVKNN